jgi:predicted GNAT family acetyltransferase
MWYRFSLKEHKDYYNFNDLSYELIETNETTEFYMQPMKIKEVDYVLKAYDLEKMDKDMPVGKMEFKLTYFKTGKKDLEISMVRTDDYHEGMGVATNLYKWLKYNIENFDKPEFLTSNPFNPAAKRIREKIFGEPQHEKPVNEYAMDYTQGKLDL